MSKTHQVRSGIARCFECKLAKSQEFPQVLNLKRSGLVIYLHQDKDREQKNTDNKTLTMKTPYETYILHNTSNHNLDRYDFISEISQYKTKCFNCKYLIKRIREVLDEINSIKEHDILGLCKHCKRQNCTNKCPRCDYIINKFMLNKVKESEIRFSKIKLWIYKVKELFKKMLTIQTVCKHKMYCDPYSANQLQILLKQLQIPLSMREPDIECFPSSEKEGSLEKELTESKYILEKILSNFQQDNVWQYNSENSFTTGCNIRSSCACKYFMNKNMMERGSMDLLTDIVDNEKNVTSVSNYTKPIKQKSTVQKNVAASDNGFKGKAKIVKDLKKKCKRKKKYTELKVKVTPKIESLPIIQPQSSVSLQESNSSTSILVCKDNNAPTTPKKIIKGTHIIPLDVYRKNQLFHSKSKPLIFEVKHIFSDSGISPHRKIRIKTSDEAISKEVPFKNHERRMYEQRFSGPLNGYINYTLSDRSFIEKGWTQLPIQKEMRKTFIYKMVLANPENNWFEHNKGKILLYDSCEKLAIVENNGTGKMFYRNGSLALNHYVTQSTKKGDTNRIVVYSSGNEGEKYVTVLASFDYNGNGVVYDHYGQPRIKYNQYEGVVIDKRIGPPSHWKWHTINDSDNIEPLFIEKTEKLSDSFIEEQKNMNIQSDVANDTEDNEIKLTIEENIMKDKQKKILNNIFKPLAITPKYLKINNQFSLSILDQKHITLRFKDGQNSAKINLGMILVNNNIIDALTEEVLDVNTPFDIYPPKTSSIDDIQRSLKMAHILNKAIVPF